MRSIEEIRADVQQALGINHADRLQQLADELDVIDTAEARALMHSARGQSCALHGNHQEALEHYETALGMYRDLGDRISLARTIGSIGNVRKSIGEYPAALEHYHRALAMFDELGDRGGVAAASTGIGMLHWFNGNYPETLKYFYSSLAQHEALGDVGNVAIVTGNIGIVLLATGDYNGALIQFNHALALNEKRGALHSVANLTGSIGNVYWRTKDAPAALENFKRSLALHKEQGNLRGIARVTGNILSVYVAMGYTGEANELLKSLNEKQIDDPNARIELEVNRAKLQEFEKEYDSAGATLNNALVTAREHGLRAREAEVHEAIRNLAQLRNDFAGYIEHNNEFVRITEEVNGKETASKLAMQSKQREIDAERREHEKHMAVLHSTLPKHIADRVARGEVVNDSFDNAAVLFLDVVSFTTNSSELEAGEIVSLLQNIFTTFDAICAKHNVMKIKTIGDSYMAVAFDDGVPRLARTAIAMMNGPFAWPHNNEPVMFRIGLHCGPVVAGVLGTERMQYDVWGDTVNVASRMESTSEPGRIHISEAFATLLPATSAGDSFEQPLQVMERGMVEIKGKGMMKTFWLIS